MDRLMWRLVGWFVGRDIYVPEPLFAWAVRRELRRKGLR
jgi:hypothetical protein